MTRPSSPLPEPSSATPTAQPHSHRLPDIARLDLVAARQQIASGRASAHSLMQQCVDAARAPACAHAFVRTDFDAALVQAAAFDARHTASTPAVQALARSPLSGLAVSIKDLFDVAGQVSAAGSTVLAGAPPAAEDGEAVARLRAAGGIALGRTHMVEFAYSGVGTNPHFATPACVADATTQRVPGGSSSGAGVSVASGAAFVGLGSDTGGSIRIPAALNGIVGFKCTAQAVPTTGSVPLSPTLDTACALTRSVRDAVVVHEVLAARQVVRGAAPLSSWRLAVARSLMLDGLDATVARAFERTLHTLSRHGARITEVDLPELREMAPMLATGGFVASESYQWHRELLRQSADGYDPRVRARIERGATMKAWEYLQLVHDRQRWIHRVAGALHGLDAVLSPTVPIVAPPIAQVAPGAERDDEFFRVNGLLLRNTTVVNFYDGCAISIPCHSADELPVGLMIWSGNRCDDAVLNIALQAEAALKPGSS